MYKYCAIHCTCMLSLRIYVLYEYSVHTSMLAWYCVIKVTVQGTRIQRYRKNRRTRADQSFFWPWKEVFNPQFYFMLSLRKNNWKKRKILLNLVDFTQLVTQSRETRNVSWALGSSFLQFFSPCMNMLG